MANNENKNEKESKIRTTLFIKKTLVSDLGYIAKMEYVINSRDASRTDIVNEALNDYATKWKKKHENS